jgi:hypothetical protein
MANVKVIQRFPGGGMVPFGEGFSLPVSYKVSVDDPQYPFIVELDVSVLDGQPQCRELRVKAREGGPPVTGEELRKLRVAGFLRHTARYAAYRHEAQPDGSVKFTPVGEDEDVDTIYSQLRKRGPRRERDYERLKEVASIYRAALARREPPTKTVARELSVAESTAAKLVRAARDKGLLKPTTRGRARA